MQPSIRFFQALGFATIFVCTCDPVQATWPVPVQQESRQPVFWTGPEGTPLPFSGEEEIKSFLRTAEVLQMEKIPEGITGVRRVTLEKDGIRLRAVFRTIDTRKERRWEPSAAKDYHLYECAAYELSRMLGLDIVPPVVERRIESEDGTIQLWIENAMMDKERVEEGLTAPDSEAWALQKQAMFIFDNLIYNDDRHLGNILIDEEWKIWLIDHTRSFRTFIHLRDRKRIEACQESLWESLKSLNKKALKERLSPFLTKEEVRTLEKRRKRLVEYIQELIEDQSEKDVIIEP